MEVRSDPVYLWFEFQEASSSLKDLGVQPHVVLSRFQLFGWITDTFSNWVTRFLGSSMTTDLRMTGSDLERRNIWLGTGER